MKRNGTKTSSHEVRGTRGFVKFGRKEGGRKGERKGGREGEIERERKKRKRKRKISYDPVKASLVARVHSSTTRREWVRAYLTITGY